MSDDPLVRLREQNEELGNQLTLNGMGLDPSLAGRISLDVLLDLLMPEGGPLRHLYNVQREMTLNGVLQEVVGDIARNKLLEGVTQ